MPEPAKLSLDLIISHEPWRDIEALEALVTRAATAACKKASGLREQQGPFEVAINLSNDDQVKQLNHQFLGKDKPTNVLSFPFEDDFPQLRQGPEPLGDIILALETITREALDENKPVGHHIAHLVVHGVLHLFGYDHEALDDAIEMEELERQILSAQHIPSPYLDV